MSVRNLALLRLPYLVHFLFCQIFSGGHFKSTNKLNVSVLHLLRINSGGRLSHNHAGYITKDGRTGNEFEPSEGPGQGTGSSSGASGAGYAGTGGRGADATRVGQFYGDYRKPFDYGSAGGYGLHYGKRKSIWHIVDHDSINQNA